FQRVLLRRRQFAGTAFVAEIRQPIEAFLAIQLVPVTNCVIVQVEYLRDRRAAHAIVEQQQRIRPPRQAGLRLPVPHQRYQVGSRTRIKKATANHSPTRSACPRPSKLFRQSMESRYNCNCLILLMVSGAREKGVHATMWWRERLGIGLRPLATFMAAFLGLALVYGLLFLVLMNSMS